MAVPDSWAVTSRSVVGTALQGQASECASAEVLDSPAPSGSVVADLQRTAIQICVVPRQDTLPLDQWLSGRGVPSAPSARYGGCDVIAPPGSDARRLAYAQSTDRRAEIVTTITSSPSTTSLRRREVADALSTMHCPSS